MSSNEVGTQASERRRMQYSRWAIRLLIAFLLSAIIVLAFFTSGAISR